MNRSGNRGKGSPAPLLGAVAARFARSRALPALARRATPWVLVAASALLAETASAQVIFGARVNGPDGPATGLFLAGNGNVTPIATGLPSNDFASLAPNARLITISSPDPAQPNEASTDLFAHDPVAGTTRKLVDNVTQEQGDGSFLFASPLFSATSADGQLVAFVNQLSSSNDQQQGGSVRNLNVIRASDGFLLSTAELGQGNAIDFYQSEFVGITWSRSSAMFVAPAYVDVFSNTGRPTVAAGLVAYGPQGSTGQFVRLGALTVPRVFDNPGQIVVETHALPAFSPSGTRLAFFRITYPDVLMMAPASAELIVIDLQGNGVVLAAFNPGFFPMGVAWSADESTLVFSLANQVQGGGTFLPAGDPASAALLTIDSVNGGALGGVPGAPTGYFPNVVATPPLIFRSGFEAP